MPGAVSPLLAAKAEKAWKRRKAAKKAVKKASKMTSTEAARHKNSQVAAASSSSQATATGNSSNTKSFGSAKVQGTTTFTAPTLSETIKNLSNAAKNGSTTQNTPAQNISIPLFDNHQPVKNEGGNLSSASSTKSNSVLSRGILGAAQGNEAATIKNNTTGRTFVNSRGETVKVDAPQKPSLSERMSNATKGKILTPGASYAHDIQKEKEYKKGLEGATKITRYDDLTVGHGGILEGSSAEDHIKKDDEKEMQDNVDFILSNQASLKNPEDAAEYLAYVAGFNKDTQGFLLRTYYAAEGDQKLKILNGILASAGWTRQTEYLYDSLSSEEQKKADDMRVAAIGGGDYEAGKEKLDDYYSKLKDQKELDYKTNEAKDDTGLDYVVGTADNKIKSGGVSGVDYVRMGVDYLKTIGPRFYDWAIKYVKNNPNFTDKEKEKEIKTLEEDKAAAETSFEGSPFDIISDKLDGWVDDQYKELAIDTMALDSMDVSPATKAVGNFMGVVAQQVPSILLGMVNPALGLTYLGVSSAGMYARYAYNSGASLDDALAFGLLAGGAEVATEKLFTGFGWFGKGIVGSLAKKSGIKFGMEALDSVSQKVLKTTFTDFEKTISGKLLKRALAGGGEASEEMIMQLIQPSLERATFNPDAKNATLKEVAAAGGMGFLVSEFLGVPATVLGVCDSNINAQNMLNLTKASMKEAGYSDSQITGYFNSVKSGIKNGAAVIQTVKAALNAKTQQAVAKFQQSAFGKALSYFAAHGVTVSPEEAGLVVQAYLKDSSGEHGSEITSTSGQQEGTGQSVDSTVADSSANKSGATATPQVVAAQEESAEEDSPHVVSSQKEAIAELRKVAATKKPGEWISVVKVDGKGATQYTAMVSPTHDIQQVQSGVADPKVYKNSRGKQAENQAANELKKTSQGGILDAGGVGGNERVENNNKPKFTYKNNPMDNPKAAKDIVENPDAVYGFSPKTGSSLDEYVNIIDWTNPEEVAKAQVERINYHKKLEIQKAELDRAVDKLIKEGRSMEDIAIAKTNERNSDRINMYLKNGNYKGLEALKARNMKYYQNPYGPTPEQMLKKYGSWEKVIYASVKSNSGMDACTGLYDIYGGNKHVNKE